MSKVTDAMVAAACSIWTDETSVRTLLEAAEAVREPDLPVAAVRTDPSTSSGQAVQALRERAKKAEADCGHWAKDYDERGVVVTGLMAQVADLTARVEKAEARAEMLSAQKHWVEAELAGCTAKLDEARGVLREIQWIPSYGLAPSCHFCEAWERYGHNPGCRLAAVIAPETGKEPTNDAR